MKIRRILLYVLIGVFLSAIVALATVSNHPRFKKRFEAYCVETAQKGLKCSFSARLDAIDLVRGVCTFTEIAVSDPKGLWQWSAKRARITFSWFDFLLTRLIRTRVVFEGFRVYSAIDNGALAITEHLNAWAALPPGPVPVVMRSVSILHGHMACALRDDPASRLEVDSNVQTYHKRDVTNVDWVLDHGQLHYHGASLFKDIKGTCHMQLFADDMRSDVNLEGVCDYLRSKRHCFCSGTWQHDEGELKLHTQHGADQVTLAVHKDDIVADGALCLDTLADIMQQQKPDAWKGHCDCTIRLVRPAVRSQVTSSWRFKDPKYKNFNLPSGTITLAGTEHAMQGHCALKYRDHKMQGTCGWNFGNQTGAIKLANKTPYTIPLFGAIDVNKAQLDVRYNAHNNQVDAQLGCDVHDTSINITRRVDGVLTGDKQRAVITCSCGDDRMDGELLYKEPVWVFSHARYKRHDQELASLKGHKDGSFSGHVRYGLINDLVHRMTSFTLSGDGDLMVSGKLLDNGIKTKLVFKDGQLFLPHTYNGLCGATLNAVVDYKKNEISTLAGSHFVLNKGDIDVSNAKLLFDQNWLPTSCTLPVILKECFVHWKKEMAATLSGSLLGTYKQGSKPQVRGNLVVDKGHIQKNVLSLSFGKDFQSGLTKPFINPAWDSALDVAVSSQSSIPVKTPFLTTEARFKLSLTGSIAEPRLQGVIDVMSGTLNFPYQPLHIDHGHVFFSSEQPDPVIELIARDKIQKYHVTLTATGSIRQPRITFESSPMLSEGQIMTLLLGGAADGSLYLAMPVGLAQTVEKLLFGASDTASATKSHIANIFKPFKNLRIIPRLGEDKQSGVKGGVMLEINDNLRASVQRNFNAAEESRFEVEYGLTDDMTVRAVKDEHGDVGAEIEKTWKFS